ncbi:FAD-dependent oxidoreductase [Winogradskyella sp. DF17]|uniref:FAD-dependent oxidoreductase n=1 Tax=Winogradskyella pelagia TaxID=2819984 RepID=A0ABS3SZ25_9FLAO|nr:FAD-dependent oxidoreductase [Winogradskyella sp. DF17]MBO3115299.1 FAD-dependent oxidoreductase [Winogradskyella sp. DF17]
MKKIEFDVVVVGGGLAGLCSAIHLAKSKFKVLLLEKNTYPKHKVCGEYISNEVLPYVKWLGFDPFSFSAKRISNFELTTHNNKHISARLPLGGFGMSRFEMDYQLAQIALDNNVTFIHTSVIDIKFEEASDEFKTTTKSGDNYRSKIVIGAYGKRSNLDVTLKRKFIKNRAPYLGVKAHVSGNFPEDKVALHNFKGGYCGVSKVENDYINLCYITNFKSFKKFKDIKSFQEQVLFKNKALRSIFTESIMEFTKPLTISQISFDTKTPVENHILMCGDTAGMIHPLCGNGMGMAIRSAQLASDLIIEYLQEKIETREKLEKLYIKSWKKSFSWRLRAGHTIAYLFRQDWLAPKLLILLRWFPFLVPNIIKMTHGKPMIVPFK